MATNARKDFPVFDCDSHVVEPPAVWDEYVPARSRAWVKTQFCFHTDSDLLFINGRVVPAARERSNAAEVGWARWDKKEVGKLGQPRRLVLGQGLEHLQPLDQGCGQVGRFHKIEAYFSM